MIDYDDELDKVENRLDVIESWEITNIDKKGLEIKFKFKDHLNISHANSPDMAIVQIVLGRF